MELQVQWTGYEAGVDIYGNTTYRLDGTGEGGLRVPQVYVAPTPDGDYHMSFVPRKKNAAGERVSVNGERVGEYRDNQTPASEWGLGSGTETVTTALVVVPSDWVEALVASGGVPNKHA